MACSASRCCTPSPAAWPARIFLLGGVYAAVLVFGWPVLALCLLGLIEAAIDLRARIARKRGPPAPT